MAHLSSLHGDTLNIIPVKHQDFDKVKVILLIPEEIFLKIFYTISCKILNL